MIKKIIFKNIYFPNFCKNIQDHNLIYIHEYRLKEFCENIYKNTYYNYLNGFDFLETDLISLNLSNGLNYLRSNSNITSLPKNINIKNINLLNSWIKYGSVKNCSKFLGLYNKKEIIHELCTGMIGPEIQSIWDQKGIKQKVRFIINLDHRDDIFEFERDLLFNNNKWQLCNINRIIF